MTGCRIGKIKMKAGGAEIRVHPFSYDSVRTVKYSWGEITFRSYDESKPLANKEMLYMLRCAEENILRGETC